MIKVLLSAVFALMAAAPAVAGGVTLKVKNSLPWQRQELVEVNAADVYAALGVKDGTPFIVRNALGQEVAHQITYDKKLLVEVSVHPKGTAVLNIEQGTPEKYTSYVYGQVWPERLDDMTWENDRGIYRMYGPALQRTGERSFGTDLWTKSTPYLDAANRYKAEFSVRNELRRLRSEGKKAEAAKLEASISYHLDHGTGLDPYGVGPTLGCGAPALMNEGKLVLPYCWQKCDILDNGPLRFTMQLTYGQSTVGKNKKVVEHRLVSLDKGSNYNRMTVWYDGLSGACDLASGVVVHSADTTTLATGADFALYADPTDRPEKLNQQVFVGTVYPEGTVNTRFLPIDTPVNGVAGHLIGITKYQPGERFTYYFGSAWSANDVRTWDEWQLRSRNFIEQQRHPLTVEISK